MANTFPHHPLVQANSTHKIPDAPKVIASKAPVPARQVSVDQNHRLSLQEPHVKACDGVTLEMLHKLGAILLFGRTRDLEVWSVRLKQEDAELQIRELINDGGGEPDLNNETMDNLVLPFVFHQNENVIPVNDGIKLKRNDRVTFLINLRRKKEADGWFERNGWGIATL